MARGVAGHLLALGRAGAQWGGVHMLHPVGPLILCQLGPAVSSLHIWRADLVPTGLNVCVSVQGTRCVWPRVRVRLWELSLCGHCYRELERKVSRLDGGQRPSPRRAPQRGSPGLCELGPSKVPFLLRC